MIEARAAAAIRDAASPARFQGITRRAFALGVGITVLVNLLPAYSAYIVHSSRMVFAHLPMATMVVFTLIAWPLNLLLGWMNRAWALTRGEMILVFSMGWIAGLVPAANFMGLFIGGIAAPYYYASAENRWGDYLLDYLPGWALPTNDAGQMTWFFEGKPTGPDKNLTGLRLQNPIRSPINRLKVFHKAVNNKFLKIQHHYCGSPHVKG